MSSTRHNGIKKVKLGMVAFVVLLATLSLASCASAKTWYVDDEGRADFTKIQDAINAASSRDTIVVRDGTYTENIHVNKPLTIRSENGAEATIVQSAWPRHVFMITTDNVNISGFTIKGASNNWFDKNVNVCGIFLKYVDHCNISDNIISNKYRGIQLMYSTKNILSNNIVNSNTHFGIGLYYSSNYNTLTNNTISNNGAGILVQSSNYNTFTNNVINSNNCGILLCESNNNNFLNNNVSNNNDNIVLYYSSNNDIYPKPNINRENVINRKIHPRKIPGFEAIFAITGLLAVAYLLRRRG